MKKSWRKLFFSNLSSPDSSSNVQAEKNLLKSIIANLQDGVVVYDPDSKILLFNRVAETIFNLKSEEVVGKYFTPDSAKEKKFNLLTRVMFPSLAPLVVERSDPSVFPHLTDMSFDDPHSELFVVTDRVVDSGGQLSGFVKLIRDKTREAELTRSKTEFISIAAHQLRTPLSAINWALETLAKEPLTDEQKGIVSGGLDATVKVLRMVNDLLDVAKMEEGKFGYKFEDVNISEFLKSVIGEAQNLHRDSSVKIYFKKSAGSSVTIPVDPERLRIAFLNVLDNAIKYNVKNGKVVVNLEKLPNGPFIQIGIEDTGVGIGPEDMKRLFTKFFRAENIQKVVPDGSGLGLYIAKNIMRSHGGEMRAESEVNRGTTIYLTLPTDSRLIPPKEVPYAGE